MKNVLSLISKILRINTINKKFSYSVIALFLIIVVFSTYAELQINISQGNKDISNKGTTIVNLASLSLSDSIWNYNQSGITSGGEALFNDKEVYSVTIEDTDKKELFKKSRNNSAMEKSGLVKVNNKIIKDGKEIGNIDIMLTKHYLAQKINSTLIQSSINGIVTIILLFLIITLVSRIVTKPLKELITVSDRITNGDLESRAIIRSDDEIGLLGVQFNKMAQSICDDLLKIKDTSSEMENYVSKLKEANSSMTEISSSISSSSGDLAASGEELNATIEEITSNALLVSQVVTDVFEATSETNKKSDKIAEITASGSNIIKDTISKITSVSDAFEDIENKVRHLNKQSEEVKGFTEIIESIASQTNLISLNAAIEAARAGDHGKGFAVVADEIRKLSEQSSKAVAEINLLISHIDNGIKETVTSTDRGRMEVKAGVELTMKAGDSLSKINDSINETIKLIKQIDDKSKAADEGARSVVTSCEEFAEAVEHVAISAQHLSGLAVNLHSMADANGSDKT